MKAMIIYVTLLVIGATLSAFVGYQVELRTSAAISLIVFLAMFFANFAVAWILTILIIDGSLKDAQGKQTQRDIEKSGRTAQATAKAAHAAARTETSKPA